eukprot:3111138-Prymnesium_polylepis.1
MTERPASRTICFRALLRVGFRSIAETRSAMPMAAPQKAWTVSVIGYSNKQYDDIAAITT